MNIRLFNKYQPDKLTEYKENEILQKTSVIITNN